MLLDDDLVKVYANRVRLPNLRMMLGFTTKGKFEFVKIDGGKIWRAENLTGT